MPFAAVNKVGMLRYYQDGLLLEIRPECFDVVVRGQIMGLWGWLTARRSNRVCSTDSVWLTTEAKLLGICRQINEDIADSRLILVVAHFAATLAAIKKVLDQEGVPCTVRTEPLSSKEIGGQDRSRRLLVRAVSLIADPFPTAEETQSETLQIIVAERHFLRAKDDEIVSFAFSSGKVCRLMFHTSIQDPLMRPFVGDWVGGLLSNLGMSESQPVQTPCWRAELRVPRRN